MTNNKYIMLDKSIMLALNGCPHVIDDTHPNFKEIKERVECNNFNGLEFLVDPANQIKDYYNNQITVNNGVVLYNNIPLQNNITKRIMDMCKNGDNPSFLINFLKQAVANPNPNILEQIDAFLVAVNIPIGKDGCLLAYKAVDKDYKDIYTHTIDNSVGKTISVDRKSVNDDNNVGCSHGLHCGAIEYVKSYGGVSNGTSDNKLIIVSVNPKNIVSVPKDHSYRKIRCCEYTVVASVTWDYLLNTTVQDDIVGNSVIEVEPAKEEPKAPVLSDKWSAKETKTLVQLKQKGMTYDEIGKIIGRSGNACRKRFNRLSDYPYKKLCK